MFHSNPPNRRQRAAEAEANAARERRERRARSCARRSAEAAAQQLGQCRRIAQSIADFIATVPVDLTVERSTLADAMERRAMVSEDRRRGALMELAARMSGLSNDDRERIANADLALIQTLESALHAGVVSISGGDIGKLVRTLQIIYTRPVQHASRRDATWGVR